MNAPPEPKMLQQAEKILLHPIHPQLISYCPTMDLIALVTDEENVDVYRVNGQRAFSLKRKSEDVTIETLKWQWNGVGLAVAWSDGCVDVLSVETGKTVHGNVKLPSSRDGDQVTVGCIGWGLNFIDAERVKRRTGECQSGRSPTRKTTLGLSNPTTEDWDAFKDDTNLEDFMHRQPDLASLDIAPDLPDQLAMLDTESLLPKLPVIPLPPANPMMRFMRQPADSVAFSSQVEVDGLLHSQHLRDHNSVDMFLRFTEEGSVHPSIYDSMETVNVRLPKAWNLQSKVVMHASHPYACTHSLLMETRSPTNTQKKLAWVPLTLGFIPSAGIYLHLIAAKTAQLQNLLSYLSHTLNRIHTYFKQAQDLPGKFMMNISETLEEHEEGNLVQNLYHLACTGHCPKLIHEWLVDELAEQGHKRWDNAVTSGLATVIQLLHENFLPALDRCSIIISRLKGLAEFHDRDWIFNGPITDFTALLDVLKTMRLLANTTLLYAADEKRYFTSFSKWLRYSIDFEATEPGSQSRTEMESQPPGVDIGIVLEYIQYGMSNSDVRPYLTSSNEVTGDATDYDGTLKAIEFLRGGGKCKTEALCLEKVLLQFGDGVRKLLKQVSRWQENNISMDNGIVLVEGDIGEALDMRMVFEVRSLPHYPIQHIQVLYLQIAA
jgi:anaphase-promoting complex subunit 4